jgi:hypothetical protein
MLKKYSINFIICLTVALPQAYAREPLPYPQGELTAEQIAQQVYAVAHGHLVRNSASKKNKEEIPIIVTRPPVENEVQARRPVVNTFEAYGNSSPNNPNIDFMQMAIIRSGKAKGTGVLYISHADKTKPGKMSLWLPSLRKIRRINEPAHEDAWIGTNLTYGELLLRRPEHEVHELLEDAVIEDCLPAMQLKEGEANRYTKQLPAPQCGHKGKPVYVVKSSTRFKNWWYDYHVSEIDQKTFAMYRTVYFKDGDKIKTVVVDWQSLDQEDPRISYPRYIYALSHTTGIDSMIYVPRSTVHWNQDLKDSFWSEKTLKKYGKR